MPLEDGIIWRHRRLISRPKYPMKVAAGFFHHTHGFIFVDYINADYAGEWLLYADCHLLSRDFIEFEKVRVRVDELSPMIVHLHGLDKAFNRVCGWNGRNADFTVRVRR